ncbi:YraN family protein [Patescibacteria group bacterium]|nr:YraN family protein [Patescibacteria group bacterium]
MPDLRRVFGNKAEDLAAAFLKKKGLKILAQQYKTNIGEIDLVAKDGDEIVFVEVKARRSSHFGYPEESVTKSKLKKIVLVAEQYLREKKFERAPFRIDVIAIELDQEPPKVTHLEGVGL